MWIGLLEPLFRGTDSGVNAHERLDDTGVELATRDAIELLERLLFRPRLAVGTIVGERVEDVGHGDDAGAKRDLLALNATWVTRPVPMLVMREGNLFGQSQELRAPSGQN